MKRLLNVSETAEFLGISPRTIYNGVCKKTKKPFPIKPLRIGKSLRWDIQDLEKYIFSLKKNVWRNNTKSHLKLSSKVIHKR